MRAEVVAVGTELLLGQIANTNARWISEELAGIGVDVLHHQDVGDNLDRIVEAIRLAASRADVVIVTGGLGPTQDDVTRDALAVVVGTPMVRHPEIEEMLRAKFRVFGRREMPESNLRQADVPEGVRHIEPSRGTAPGLVADLPDGATVYAVPGVPAEMVEMVEGTILPELAAAGDGGVVRSRVLRCAGIGESALAERVDDLFGGSVNPTIAFLASSGEVKVRITAKAASVAEADASIEPVAEEIRRRIGDDVFTSEDETLEEAVVRLLRAADTTLACAESLTGGGVGARITSVPGSSEVFLGSAVVYALSAKVAILGVSQETLDGPGPVSEACAREMAVGARKAFGSALGLSLTGAAGPEPHGGAEPGEIWVALEGADVSHARGFQVPGERDRVRRWAEQAALDLARRHLEGRPLPASDRLI
ncbi:MAG TPA: competence/damage-inducible protein A [Actinomycetota bacterium]|nr:competence/damage-inducible protein A [Actinomycetota bacterium]